jgi:hypothetical protein
MSWARFDDLYDDHRKIKRAWRANRSAVGLHAMAITYCSRHETDGMVDLEWIVEKLPAAKERSKVLSVLVECELFVPVDAEHYSVHDYLDYNPSQEQLRDKRERDSARKARGRTSPVRLESVRNPDGLRTDSAGSPRNVRSESARPVPARPVTTDKGPSSTLHLSPMQFTSCGRAGGAA